MEKKAASKLAALVTNGRPSTNKRVIYDPDLVLMPWHERMRPMSKVPVGLDQPVPANEPWDIQYAISSDECIYCQASYSNKTPPPQRIPAGPYNVWVVLHPTTVVSHNCPQRAVEQTPVGLVVVWIQSIAHPLGEIRCYTHKPDEIKGVSTTIEPLRELGHLFDHAGAIFCHDEEYVFSLLRFRPFLVTDIRHIDVCHPFARAWPALHDTLVPDARRADWNRFLAQGPYPFDQQKAEYLKQQKQQLQQKQRQPFEKGREALSLQGPPNLGMIQQKIAQQQPHPFPQKSAYYEEKQTSSLPPTQPMQDVDDEELTQPQDSKVNSGVVNTLIVSNQFETDTETGCLRLVDPPVLDPTIKDWENVLDTESWLHDWTFDESVDQDSFNRVKQQSSSSSSSWIWAQKPAGLTGFKLIEYHERMRKEALKRQVAELQTELKNRFPTTFGPFDIKPPDAYFSSDRMRSWYAKCQPISRLLYEKKHIRPKFDIVINANQNEEIWSSLYSRHARLAGDPHSAKLLTSESGYIAMWRARQWARLHESLCTELRYLVDFSWCVYAANMRIRYPEKMQTNNMTFAYLAGRALHKRYGVQYASKHTEHFKKRK